MPSWEVKCILNATMRFANSSEERAFAKFFAGDDLRWMLRAARSGVWKDIDTGGLEALLEMAAPVGGLEGFARLLDETMGRWPGSRGILADEFRPGSDLARADVAARNRWLWHVGEMFGYGPHGMSEVQYFMSANLDPAGLSRDSRNSLFFMYMAMYSVLNAAGTIHSGAVALQTGWEKGCEIQNSVIPVSSDYPTLVELREALCGVGYSDPDIDKIRTVKGVKVQLRQGPSKEHGLVMVNLEDRDLLIAVDETNPEWAHVRLKTDPQVTGWIAKKYVHVPR